MLKTFRYHLKKYLRPLSIMASVWFPNQITLNLLRRMWGIQLTEQELSVMTNVIKQKNKCNLLIFGLGNDSVYWRSLNTDGNTAFLENDQKWINHIKMLSPDINAYLVTYTTNLKKWLEEIEQPAKLSEFVLSPDILNKKWDVIIVDAPPGYSESMPGRLQSIYAARELAAEGGSIFVHDVNRELEKTASLHFFGTKRLIGHIGNLYHFVLFDTDFENK